MFREADARKREALVAWAEKKLGRGRILEATKEYWLSVLEDVSTGKDFLKALRSSSFIFPARKPDARTAGRKSAQGMLDEYEKWRSQVVFSRHSSEIALQITADSNGLKPEALKKQLTKARKEHRRVRSSRGPRRRNP